MDNLHYDFHNTGYKIHLPVVPDVNDPLTKEITDFLDQKFGQDESSRWTVHGGEYQSPCYKVGSGGELEGGKGITLYGRNGSMQEMQDLAKEIEEKFGDKLADNVKKHNITFDDPKMLSDNVQARFAVYHHWLREPGSSSISDIKEPLQQYCWGNKSGALPIRTFKQPDGSFFSPCLYDVNGLSELEKKFFDGDSTMYALDNFGELFTGKIENGKVPDFIMDGLPKEYLEHYNLTEKDILGHINKGTKQITACMLEDIANKGEKSALLRQGATPWLTTLEPEVLDEAKQLLAQYEPEAVKKLEQELPNLEKACPELSILQKTTAFKDMKLTPPEGHLGHIYANHDKMELPKRFENMQNGENVLNEGKGWWKNLSKKGKIGIGVTAGVVTLGTIYALSHNKPKEVPPTEDTQIADVSTSNNTENPYQNTTNPCSAPSCQKPYNYHQQSSNMAV